MEFLGDAILKIMYRPVFTFSLYTLNYYFISVSRLYFESFIIAHYKNTQTAVIIILFYTVVSFRSKFLSAGGIDDSCGSIAEIIIFAV